MNYNIFRNETVKISQSKIDAKSKLVNLNYILDYKLVIEKILKLAIRQVIKIYVVYSAQN